MFNWFNLSKLCFFANIGSKEDLKSYHVPVMRRVRPRAPRPNSNKQFHFQSKIAFELAMGLKGACRDARP